MSNENSRTKKNLSLIPTDDNWFRAYWGNEKHIGTFYPESHGYYVYLPNNLTGFWEANALREIADALDGLNKEWNEQVTRDVANL